VFWSFKIDYGLPTVRHAFVIRQLLEKNWNFKRKLSMLSLGFIDGMEVHMPE
jgi:hypothetical protein